MIIPKSRIWGWLAATVAAAVVMAGCGAIGQNRPGQGGNAASSTAEVIAITAVSSVDASGQVAAQQSATVFWETTGLVASVAVAPGDHVKRGDVLMALDPGSVPQSIIQAQAELINAQEALDALLHPAPLTIANAQQAVADAQDQLLKAERDLRYAQNPAGQSLFDAVDSAQLALETAQANAQLANVSPDVQAYEQAVASTNVSFSNYQNLQAKWDAGDHSDGIYRALEGARAAYQAALDNKLALELRINTDRANKDALAGQAQRDFDQATANLNAALRGPDALRLTLAQARVAVAEASLADLDDQLDRLINGADPGDLLAAQVRVQAAQATLDMLSLRAPFDGEVLVINYQPGDTVSQGLEAVLLANRSRIHVDASVDESDVGQLTVGDEVELSFDSLPDLVLPGTVAWINPVGQTVQGLVKYTVRVAVAQTDPRVLLGMTANLNIVTEVQAGALAVPLDAVQLDERGEFVNRVTASGAIERVDIVSGQLQEEVVVVSGNLQPGDIVQLVEPQPATNPSPFGGGG